MEGIVEAMRALTGALNPVSLAIVSFIEAIFFPIPPDTILLPMALLNPALAPTYALIATTASVAGAAVGYWLGLRGGRPVLQRVAARPAIARVEDLFSRYDMWAIAMAGFTPVPYKVFAIAAGVFGLDISRFLIASLISRGLRFMLGALLVMFYGEAILDFLMANFGTITLALFALAAAIYGVWSHWFQRGAR